MQGYVIENLKSSLVLHVVIGVPSRLQNSHFGSEVSDMSLGTLTINGVTHSMVPSYPNRYGRLPRPPHQFNFDNRTGGESSCRIFGASQK